MMACPDLQFESEYIQTLAAMTSYSIENKELKLTDKDRKQTLVFVPKTEEKVIGVANDATDVTVRQATHGLKLEKTVFACSNPVFA